MFMSSWERRRRIPVGFGRAFGRAFGRTSGQTSGRTVVGGARVVSGAEIKNHLIEAAPFGHLDQMLMTSERR